jgi:hypothetical protein
MMCVAVHESPFGYSAISRRCDILVVTDGIADIERRQQRLASVESDPQPTWRDVRFGVVRSRSGHQELV